MTQTRERTENGTSKKSPKKMQIADVHKVEMAISPHDKLGEIFSNPHIRHFTNESLLFFVISTAKLDSHM